MASWSCLRTMLSKYTLCARRVASTKVLDLSREGMIKGITEHSEFVRFFLGDALADFAPIRPPVRAPKRRRCAGVADAGLATPPATEEQKQQEEGEVSYPAASPGASLDEAKEDGQAVPDPDEASRAAPLEEENGGEPSQADPAEQEARPSQKASTLRLQCSRCLTWRVVPHGVLFRNFACQHVNKSCEKVRLKRNLRSSCMG